MPFIEGQWGGEGGIKKVLAYPTIIVYKLRGIFPNPSFRILDKRGPFAIEGDIVFWPLEVLIITISWYALQIHLLASSTLGDMELELVGSTCLQT